VATNNIISRTDSAALVPEVVSNQILGDLNNESAALTMFRQVRMSTAQTRMPVLSALPIAYWVAGDTGLKQTTEVNWANKFLNVEELAAIVPIPEAVLDDIQYDTWGTVRPLLANAIARALDAAIFFGASKPASWPNDITTDAVAAGNTVHRGTNATAAGGIYGDLSAVFGAVESDGYDVNGLVASTTYKGLLRNARSTQGEALDDMFSQEIRDMARYPMRGLWPTGTGSAEVIAGDFTQGILGVRQDITWKVLDQAVIQNQDGTIAFNLAQQDMVALRVVARFAFQVANTINYDQPVAANRYPFAVLRTP
jgi:HK97 family phage major capsid protein